MKTFCIVLCCVSLCIFSLSFAQDSGLQQMDAQAMNTMLALNYCHLSLVKILAYQDRVILDEEYHNIINNIRLSAIEDKEIITLLQDLMDTLHTFKLAEEEKELLIRAYNTQVANSVYAVSMQGGNNLVTAYGAKTIFEKVTASQSSSKLDTVADNAAKGVSWGPYGTLAGAAMGVGKLLFSGTAGTNPLGFGLVSMYALSRAGGMYQHYRENTAHYRESLEKKLWELDKESMQAIHELRKAFLQVSWTLMKRYEVPERWRLTETQFQRAIEVFKEPEAEKRYRQLTLLQDDFTMFPPFWYTFARTAQDVGDLELALEIYQRIEKQHRDFFRQDHEFSSALMDKVVLIRAIQETHPELLEAVGMDVNIPFDLERIVQQSSGDWRKKMFAALQYIELQQYETARQLVQANLDNGRDVSLNSRVLGDIYALSGDEEQLGALIEQMCQDDQSRYQDALYLIGRIRDGRLLQSTLDAWLAPVLVDTRFAMEGSWIGDDVLTVDIPLVWLKDTPEYVGLRVLMPGSDTEYWTDDAFEIDTEQERVIFSVTGVLDKDDVLEQHQQTTMLVELISSAESVVFLVEAAVQEVTVDKNLLDKTVDTSRGVLNTTVGVMNAAKGLFSKDNDEEAEASPSSEQEKAESPGKTERQIVFTIRNIETSNACYNLSENSVKRLSACVTPE